MLADADAVDQHFDVRGVGQLATQREVVVRPSMTIAVCLLSTVVAIAMLAEPHGGFGQQAARAVLAHQQLESEGCGSGEVSSQYSMRPS